MSRKISLALAASAIAFMMSGTAGATFPSADDEDGPAAGTTPTTSYERALTPSSAATGDCFPSAATECGPALGETPTMYGAGAVGASTVRAGGVVPCMHTAEHEDGSLLDD